MWRDDACVENDSRSATVRDEGHDWVYDGILGRDFSDCSVITFADYVDMDGANLLAEDAAAGVTVLKGRCHFPDITGNGIASIDRDRSNAL